MLMLYRAWTRRNCATPFSQAPSWPGRRSAIPYYAIYCLMLGAVFLGSRLVDVHVARRKRESLTAARNLLNVAIVAGAARSSSA
jgi:hypothetical protein